jgi:hypothetical protein
MPSIGSSNNPNIAEHGRATRFSSENQPAKKGRKPYKLKKYIKDNDLSLHDQILIFKELIAKRTLDEIKQIVKAGRDRDGVEVSVLIWGFCVAFLADCKKGMPAVGIYNQMLDREHGKARQPIEHSGAVGVTEMTHEEREKLINEYVGRYVKENPDLLPGGGDDAAGPPAGLPGRTEKTEQEKS